MENAADPHELAELADLARKYFRWSIALLLLGLGILALDMMLKRAVAEQAADASQTLGMVKAYGRGAPPDVAAAGNDGGQPGGGGGDAVDGGPGVAAGDGTAVGPKPPRKRGVEQRPGSDAP